MKKILLIWSGAREHIVAKKLCENPEVKLFAWCPSENPWILELADEAIIWWVWKNEFQNICHFAEENKIDWAFIWPDNPIWDWLADELKKSWFPSFAPNKSLARLESSKWFTRKLIEKYWIDWNPEFKNFEWNWEKNKEAISEFLDKLWDEYVIKYDALFWWKWVKLSWEHLGNKDEWISYAMECLDECGKVVIEEKFVWEEFSLLCFADWNSIASMPTIQDHKRAFEWDTWPNTGWMWTYSEKWWILPFIEKKDIEEAEKITIKIMQSLKKECWEKYKWIMYWGFILTKNWVKVIEYNARFWDPEVMNLLTLLKTDLTKICEACIDWKLKNIEVSFEDYATVCKYIAVNWYPENPKKWEKLVINFDINKKDESEIYFWSIVRNEDWSYTMWSSRNVAIIAKAWDIETAWKLVDEKISKMEWDFFYRKDIWTKELIQKKINRMKEILE